MCYWFLTIVISAVYYLMVSLLWFHCIATLKGKMTKIYNNILLSLILPCFISNSLIFFTKMFVLYVWNALAQMFGFICGFKLHKEKTLIYGVDADIKGQRKFFCFCFFGREGAGFVFALFPGTVLSLL